MKLRGTASRLRRGTLKLRGRGTWLGAGAVALAVPAMFFSRRVGRFLFEHHDDALIALQGMPGVGVLLGSLASRRKSGPPPPLYETESMRVVRDAVAKVGPTGATVVLRGETGVGKERHPRLVATPHSTIREDQLRGAPVPREIASDARRRHVGPRHRRRAARAQGDLTRGRTRSRARRAARGARARGLESPARRPASGHQLSLAPLQTRGPSAAAAGSRRGRRL